MEQISEQLQLEFNKAKRVFADAQKICIISHRSPDGDAVGSNLALRFGLENAGKTVVSACVDKVPENSIFLKKADSFVQDFNYEDFDCIVSVDCGDIKLVKFHETKPEIFSGEKPFVNFDHHESNNYFGTINPVDPHAAATCVIIYKFFKFCEWPITIDVANALLHGIYFDTGGMIHSNATAEVFRIAGELMLRGADIQKISKELFHTTPVNKLRLWGRILERTYVNEDGVTISAAGASDYMACGATSHDTGGVIDYLNCVPDSKYCILLSEDEKGIVKGSLRTQRNDVNLSEVAKKWGGGGHPKASGFGITGKLQPVFSWKVVDTGGDAHGEETRF
ncbi:MAG: DHH family phosphoesterase [Candidatus Gracilibacteria bacterium]|jgi:phosphoesterase RecJ-like protein